MGFGGVVCLAAEVTGHRIFGGNCYKTHLTLYTVWIISLFIHNKDEAMCSLQRRSSDWISANCCRVAAWVN